jgi:hypothetical protein
MLLYHGTSEWAAEKARTKGIQPRRVHGMTNWDHTIESHRDAVYLTDTYACHYAISAMLNAPRMPDLETILRKRIAVIEINTQNLVQNKLHPDEDAMEQSERKKDSLGHLSMVGRTKIYRTLARKSPEWERSLSLLGTCAYYGPIAPRHITRIAYFKPKMNRIMARVMMDGIVSVQSFKFCGYVHKNCIKWLFGEPVTPEGIDDTMLRELRIEQVEITPEMQTFLDQTRERYEKFKLALEDRSGIELVDLTKTGLKRG